MPLAHSVCERACLLGGLLLKVDIQGIDRFLSKTEVYPCVE